MLEISLSGKTILVTGALGGIATAVNQKLLQAGATLILTDIIEKAEAEDYIAKKNYPYGGWFYKKMDVTDTENVNKVITDLFDEHPDINILIGLAGGCGMHPFKSTPVDEFNRIFTLNYFGQINPTRKILKEWGERSIQGHVIYTSSLVASLPWIDLSAYISAKAGVESLCKCLALEYASEGIRFNCIAPGHVAAGSSLKVYETDPVYHDMTNHVIPLARLVHPDSIADAFVFLCSEMARDIDGQVIKVDCGASIPKVG
jgi:NAD(P)-dependent dehydrogenase (short-subunit alcohol dehydrogenase family)